MLLCKTASVALNSCCNARLLHYIHLLSSTKWFLLLTNNSKNIDLRFDLYSDAVFQRTVKVFSQLTLKRWEPEKIEKFIDPCSIV